MGTDADQDMKAKMKVQESIDSVIETVSKRIVNAEYPFECDPAAVSALAELVIARATVN